MPGETICTHPVAAGAITGATGQAGQQAEVEGVESGLPSRDEREAVCAYKSLQQELPQGVSCQRFMRAAFVNVVQAGDVW